MSTTYSIGTGTSTGAAGQTTLACVLSAVAESQAVIRDFVLANVNSPIFLEKRTLTTGVFQALTDTAGTIPVKAGGVIIFPASGTTALTLKGVTGDTGISMHPTAPFVLTFPTSHASLAFGLLATGSSLEFTLAWF
jgi:hypothetical protein